MIVLYVWILKYLVWTVKIFYVIPLICVILLLAVIAGVVIRFKTHCTKPPNIINIFTMLSLIITLHWLWVTADLITKIMDIFGFILGVPGSYIGITLLAIGNSLIGK